MATTDISGGRNQKWISRDALQRKFTLSSGVIATVSLSLSIFLAGGLCYVASLPREVPYVLHEDTSGHFDPVVQTATADDAAKRFLITTWIGAWRLGCNDPHSMCAEQTSALVSSATGDQVAAQVKAYNQAIADSGWRVTPAITNIDEGTDPGQYEVRWIERAENANHVQVEHVMRAIVTLSEAPGYKSVHGALLNPFGEYISDLRVIEESKK